MNLTRKELSYIVDTCTGYMMGFEKMLDEFQLDVEELEEILLNENVERCPGCGWQVPSHELLPPDCDEPDGHCENCR